MNTIVLASNNEHKRKEFKKILSNYNIVTLEEIGFVEDIEETGETFEENATIKSLAIHNYLKEQGKEYYVIGEDSGLCCKALNGAPGIYSARYAGDHNDQKNRNQLIKDLEGKEKDAYFISCIVLISPDGNKKTFVGTTEGSIIKEERGKKDFGYDCIFLSKDLGITFGEATEEEKNNVSHRKRAIEKLVEEL